MRCPEPARVVAVPSQNKSWIAVDLDGTLAHEEEFKGIEHIGAAIPGMLRRVKAWINQGKTVKIFTARAANPKAIPYIEDWLEAQGISGLEVTNQKDMHMIELWDDLAIQVKKNTGVPVRG